MYQWRHPSLSAMTLIYRTVSGTRESAAITTSTVTTLQLLLSGSRATCAVCFSAVQSVDPTFLKPDGADGSMLNDDAMSSRKPDEDGSMLNDRVMSSRQVKWRDGMRPGYHESSGECIHILLVEESRCSLSTKQGQGQGYDLPQVLPVARAVSRMAGMVLYACCAWKVLAIKIRFLCVLSNYLLAPSLINYIWQRLDPHGDRNVQRLAHKKVSDFNRPT
ncbi:hypothetical protein BaRGS_00015083 [Batillaria attramentaria]|uniref:Uncharacterized protein n=1 Tax=Batillaria attramentaria TaxID=370345 RepID=A0ABD0L237_9CAEN